MIDLDDTWDILDRNNIAISAKTRSEICSFIKVAKSRGIGNYSDALARFAEFPKKQKNTGIWLFARLRNKKAVPLLLALLEDQQNDTWEICASLVSLGGKEAIEGLKKKLEKEKSQEIREAIVYALSFADFDKGIAMTMIRLAKNRQEPPQIRAQAAEGIGILLQGCKTKSSFYNEAHQCLLGLRKNKNADIRFNAYFALSSLRRKEKNEEKGGS